MAAAPDLGGAGGRRGAGQHASAGAPAPRSTGARTNLTRTAREILLAVTGIESIPGGIAAANRNVLRGLLAVAERTEGAVRVLSLLEGEADRPRDLPAAAPFRGFGGDRRRFALALWAAAPRRPLYCFDHVRLALPLLPLAAPRLARTVIFAHGSEAWKRTRLGSRWALGSARLCLANSTYTWRKMNEALPGLRGGPCVLGLPPDFHCEEAGPRAAPPEIQLTAADGTVGRIGPRALLTVARMDPAEREKGHDELLAVLPRLRRRHHGVQLVFAGPGEDRETIAATARARGVGGCVFLPGYVAIDRLRELYRACYAYVMPSRQEGLGLAYLEAMSFAKPCLGCFDQGAEDVIVPEETGLLVRDPRDGDELFGALTRLLDDPERAAGWGRNGLARVRASFTAEHHQGRVASWLQGLLA